MKKKIIYLCSFVIITLIPMISFASEVPIDSVPYNGIEWQRMRQNDIAEYDAKLNAIDEKLVNDVNTFITENQELSLVVNNMNKSTNAVGNDNFLQAFLESYPEYISMKNQISDDVELLRFNPVVEAVRAFFNANGYALSLDLFNHSLTDNPAPASLSLTGNTAGMYGHIRTLLTNDPFLNKMATFAGQSSMTQTIADYSHTFDSGDLYWSIHGFYWTRTRIAQGKASFAIDDVYDFNKWKDIPGIVAGVAGTHDFDVHIDGLVEYGVIK